MPRSVAIVFSADYAEELDRLAFRTPVWVVDTPANRAAAAHASRAAVEWPHITVTLFRPPADPPTRDDWHTLFAEIALQERVEGLEVIGTPLTIVAHTALVEVGFDRFEETGEGFRARRG